MLRVLILLLIVLRLKCVAFVAHCVKCVRLLLQLSTTEYLTGCCCFSVSVDSPWERAVAGNKVPYYIK